MHLKSILTSGFYSKALIFVAVISMGFVSCRKKTEHVLGTSTYIEGEEPVGGTAGTSWTQISSSEITDIYALEEFNGQLYVGGLFDNTANTIHDFAKLDASDNLIDPGISGFFGGYGIYDLHISNSDLILGGNYTYYTTGTDPEDLTRMNTSAVITDIPFSNSLGSSARNIMDYSSDLLITGAFSPSASNWVVTDNVDLISGNTAVGMANLTGTVYGSAMHNGSLFVCGPDDNLKSWSGSAWVDEIYNGLHWQDAVWDVISYNSELYIMGKFNNGVVIKRKSATGTWTDIAEIGQIGGMSFYGGMKVVDNELYVFDGNLTINGASLLGLVKYNGTSWSSVGNFTYEVHDIVKFNGYLYLASDYGIFKYD
ncbi:MAG: hypothetical protein ACI837_000789 [Crocinitomicaceae bacterium]|jgi:hypothetical protein